jgi:LCP family protein required for cell wall assembly
MGKQKQRKKTRNFTRILSVIALIVLVLLVIFLKKLNVLPSKYFYLIVCVLSVLELIFLFFAFNKRTRVGLLIVLDILFVLIVGLEGYGAYKLNETYHFIDVGFKVEETVDYYYVLANKDSSYEKLSDIENKVLYYYNDEEDIDKLKQSVNKKVNVIMDKVDDYSELLGLIEKDKEKVIIISESSYETINDNEEAKVPTPSNNTETEKVEKYKIIDKIELVKKIEKEETREDITSKPFIVYLSGIDTRSGKMPSKSLSDVNMFIVVNPTTRKILMVSVPRDYYVQLHGKTGLKDKLTHAGMNGGVKLSKATMEDLLGVEADFYVRVNFNAVIKLVDAVFPNGITINNDQKYGFTCWTDRSCYFKPGNNTVKGKCALAFARERHAYAEGDRHRGENQQQVIQLLVNKLSSSKSLLTNYDRILNALEGSFDTNLSTNNITSFIQFQLDDMRGWEFETTNLDGSNSMAKTYSFPKQDLYVMIPNQKTVTTAKEKIQEYLNDKAEPVEVQ